MRSTVLVLIAFASTLLLLSACAQTDEEQEAENSNLASSAPSLVIAGPVSTLGIFELEGNAQDDAVEGDDWETLASGGGSSFEFTLQADPDNASIFTTGGSKDIYDVSKWKWTDGSVPPKDDLLNAFAAAYSCPEGNDGCDPGDLLVYFGSDRYANNGDANIAFWFFQDDVSLKPDGTFSGVHMPGDLLIVVKYPQGSNAEPIVLGYEWVTSGGDAADNLLTKFSSEHAECGAAGEHNVCAITNHGDETAFWPYTPKFGTTGTYPYESLYEGGVNVTDLFGFTPCFSSFLAESRSSESVTSQLKDFVLGDFDLCSVDLNKECEAALQAGGDAIDVSFHGYLDNTGSASVAVELSDSDEAIDQVCFDTGLDGSCAGDASPADLAFSSGVASFTLAPGEKVLYLGEYTDTSPTVNPDTGLFEYADTVTANAWELGADHSSAAPIISETADATCSEEGTPHITISKDCLTNINSGGASVTVLVTGGGQNDGDIKLSPVTLVDSPPLDTLKVCLDNSPQNGQCDAGETVLCSDYASCSTTGFELLAGQWYAFEGEYSLSDTFEASDTMTVTGISVFDQEVQASDDAPAVCAADVSAGITVTKECAIVLNTSIVDGMVVLETLVTGKVKNTGDIEITDVTLSDSVIGAITLSDTTLSPGEEVSYTAHYFPDSVAGDGSSCAADYQDTVSASGTGALGYGLVNADTDGTPAQALAQCSLCPQVCE